MTTKQVWRRRSRVLLLSTLLPLTALAAYQPDDSNPFARHAQGSEHWFAVEGTVEERMVAGPYLYLRVRSAGSDHWVVGLKSTVSAARDVRVTVLGSARGFHSARLGREFDELWFGVVRAREGRAS